MEQNRDIHKELIKAFQDILGVKGDLFSWSELDVDSEGKKIRLEFVVRVDEEETPRFWKRVSPTVEKFKDYHSDEEVEYGNWKNT